MRLGVQTASLTFCGNWAPWAALRAGTASAFDRIIGLVPHKGQVLNQLAAWWFEQVADLVPSHVVSLPDPNALIAIDATPLPIEVVVRARLTGSTSTAVLPRYLAGERLMYGHQFPDGLTPRLSPEGRLLIIDEMHTPDSSRYWDASTLDARLAEGSAPDGYDKEPVRLALKAAGYSGEGDPPKLGEHVWLETSARYVELFERLTGTTFEPAEHPAQQRIEANLADLLK